MSVPVLTPPAPRVPFYRRKWFIIVAVILALVVFGSCLGDGGSSPSASPAASEAVADMATEAAVSDEYTPAAVAPEPPQASDRLSDDTASGLCSGHLLMTPDGENTEVDWSVNWTRVDNPDGSVTIAGQSYNLDRTGEQYPSFDVSCTVNKDKKVTDFHFVE